MKRKNIEPHATNGKEKRRALSEEDIRQSFRANLFETDNLEKYKADYATSKPHV